MKRSVVVMGFMGSGKSTAGRLLAQTLGTAFHDLDELIEASQKKTISRIFAENGEAFFRNLETEQLKEWLEDSEEGVLALGGGTPLREQNREVLKQSGALCVYLKVNPETVVERLMNDQTRPLLAGCADEAEKLEKVRTLLSARESVYESAAGLVVETDGKTPEAVAEVIAEAIAEANRLSGEREVRW